eukprot:scaffold3238_cov240-Pinguiococcus_pyrenoidosus.AAC.1
MALPGSQSAPRASTPTLLQGSRRGPGQGPVAAFWGPSPRMLWKVLKHAEARMRHKIKFMGIQSGSTSSVILGAVGCFGLPLLAASGSCYSGVSGQTRRGRKAGTSRRSSAERFSRHGRSRQAGDSP